MEKLPYIYFAFISIVSVIVTCYDKIASKREKRRIPEKNLFILSVLGGSFLTYFTMKIIRHKTKHKRFMIGLPIIMVVQILILVYISFIL